MKTSRFLSIALILALLLLLMSGCGAPANTTAKNETTKSSQAGSSTTIKEPSGQETTEPQSSNTTSGKKGSEISDFVQAYLDTKDVVWNKLSDKISESGDLAASMNLLGFSFADLSIVMWPMFDVVDEAGGVLPLLGIKNAFRTQKGNIITFGYDYTYEEDQESGNYKKGDVVSFTGEFDISKDSMKVETRDTKGGVTASRLVSELVKNKDGSYTSQLVNYDSSSDKITGYFTTFEGENIWSIIGEKEAAENFTINSIYGQPGAKLDQMTAGFKIKIETSFVDGTASFKQNQG